MCDLGLARRQKTTYFFSRCTLHMFFHLFWGRKLSSFQSKFLEKCPKAEDRFSACPDPNYGHICYYSTEWACGDQCIGKKDVCEIKRMYGGSNFNGGCDWGMKRCGEKCVDRHTPCNGHCWDDSAVHMCGDNMCLSQYQLQVSARLKRARL